MHSRVLVPILALVVGIGASCGAPNGAGGAADPVSGVWDAALTIPAGDVGFGLDLKLDETSVAGAILNGTERQDLSSGSFDGETLTLRLDYYDGTITAKFEGDDRKVLTGEYARLTSRGPAHFPFRATRRGEAGSAPRTVEAAAVDPGALDISGDWIMTVRKADGAVASVDEATFEKGAFADGRLALTGTVIPVTGDYGLLSGEAWAEPGATGAQPKFRLSRFNGIHVTLLTGEVKADGTLAGEFASGPTYRASFTAVREERATAADGELADPYSVTRVKNPAEPFAFSLPGLDGKMVSLSDERFRGKVVVIDIFGTWCPNCHDEAPFLAELHERYGKDGLEVVGLAYEYTDDLERNRRQIEIFRKKHGVRYPVLMAGTTAEGEIARTLPQLEGFMAYPTTIFVGRDGRVRKIHAGFSGPATGERFTEVKREMEQTVKELLASEQGA